MQWPNSFQIGSLPPIYQCSTDYSETYQDGSIHTGYVSQLSNTIQAQSRNETIKLRKSNTISFSDEKQIIYDEDDDSVENSSVVNKAYTSCTIYRPTEKYKTKDSNSRINLYPRII
ncbi:unnamed protein product [Schistosoma mattheei]|nr:unnamed protein product [Schistosoma mattheei]